MELKPNIKMPPKHKTKPSPKVYEEEGPGRDKACSKDGNPPVSVTVVSRAGSKN